LAKTEIQNTLRKIKAIAQGENDNPHSNRKFRNNFFEHYDERVEEYFQGNSQGVYIDWQ